MIKKIISFIGIAGIISLIVLCVSEHVFFLREKVFIIWLAVSCIFVLPILFREIFSLRKKK